MNKSTITRERLQEIAEDGFLKHGESKELALMALAAMDSEPVCFVSERNLATLTKYRAAVKVKAEPVMVRPVALYRHAQPTPIVLKDGQIRELVNSLRDIAIQYHGTQQLREQIARVVRAAMLTATPQEKSK